MTILKSKGHTIQTHTFQKRGLSIFDDKRIWLSKNKSLPHGHVDSPVVNSDPKSVQPPPSSDVLVENCRKRKMDDESQSDVVLQKRCHCE